MKLLRQGTKLLAALTVCLCLNLAAVPAQTVFAAPQEEQVAAISLNADNLVAAAPVTDNSDDEGAFMLIFLGGGLLIVLVAAVVSVATFSSAIAIATEIEDEED